MSALSHVPLSTLAVLLVIGCAGTVDAGNPRYQEEVSPDGAFVAYVDSTDGDAELYIERSDGTQKWRLTDNSVHDNDPSWAPDGSRIAFSSGQGASSQVCLIDPDGQNRTQLTHDEMGARYPRFGPQGQLAWLVDRDQAFKRKLVDLVVRERDQLRTLQQKIPVWDVVWHPTQNLIACSTDGKLILQNLTEGTTREAVYTDTDARLSSFGAFELRWSPEHDAFVGRLMFLGGLRAGSHVFGNNEEIAISSDGSFRFLNTPRESSF